jgi:hypothetical protein
MNGYRKLDPHEITAPGDWMTFDVGDKKRKGNAEMQEAFGFSVYEFRRLSQEPTADVWRKQ